jgi:hypothetical protein
VKRRGRLEPRPLGLLRVALDDARGHGGGGALADIHGESDVPDADLGGLRPTRAR